MADSLDQAHETRDWLMR